MARQLGLMAICSLLTATASSAADLKPVTFPGYAATPIQALYVAPASPTPGGLQPAVVALHGCGGNFRQNGGLTARVPDWTDRFVAAGYAVVWPDSFGSRGLGSQCGVANREITQVVRARDAVAAATWLAAQPGIDKTRIAVVGWSNGGTTVLRAISTATTAAPVEFKTAIAFYPGCRGIAERPGPDGKPWAARLPLTILMGAADDWTPPEPCRELGQRPPARYVEYAGAFHDFDAPNAPVRVRTGLAFTANKSGQAHVGTDPAARAAAIVEVMTVLDQAFK
jgi:dienelactone hydrolase